ncbi:MAG: SMC family ATPase, partial [Methanosarcinales archaeon]|nr:SMC family ATPase [Methanosarcinales archaeon]
LIGELKAALERLRPISPRLQRLEALGRELEEQSQLRERQKDLEALLSRREAVLARKERLLSQRTVLQEEHSGLGDLEAREAELLQKDRELDRLGSSLADEHSDLKGRISLCQSRLVDSQINLKRIRDLGSESNCPTCERPLKEQHGLLVEKYESQAALARESMAGLNSQAEEVRARLDAVSGARSGLKADFDRLNAHKARRAELLAGMRGIDGQMREVEAELGELGSRESGLGQFSYDQSHHSRLQREMADLQPLLAEHNLLREKVRSLPDREQELEDLVRTSREVEAAASGLKAEMQSLGYQESGYQACRDRIRELSPAHDRHSYLSRRVQEIPDLEKAAAAQREDLEGLKASCRDLGGEVASLGFDPREHDLHSEEMRSLAPAESRAQQIRLVMAGEEESRQRLAEARQALEALDRDMQEHKEKLQSLDYSPDQHQAARQQALEAEAALDGARQAASERRVRLGVLQGDKARLQGDLARRKECRAQLSSLGQRMQVVESTRSLVNRFMDQVLIRIRDDIATSAGRILDEVTGKYSLLKIDDDFNIMVEDGGEYYPISRYSGGEIDMIAVSVRVAISEYLMRFGQDQGSYSFMILDEVFGSQDIEHRERMINMLRRLEDRFPQIFTISHISDVQGQFDNTINVIEDEMGNSTVELS